MVAALLAGIALSFSIRFDSVSAPHGPALSHPEGAARVAAIAPISPRAVASTGTPPVALGVAATPQAICAGAVDSCPANAASSRVTLTALASNGVTTTWPDVQVAFVIETTAYDGIYYHGFSVPNSDPCAMANGGQGVPCEESNSVPFFEAHAGQIAESIAGANPHSHVTFALVDYFVNDAGDWSDGVADGTKYTVDIPTFVPAEEYGSAVQSTFGQTGAAWGWVGMDDNLLTSPSIVALYGAIVGSGLDWSQNTHHVIVWVGSTAPRDPNYVENYLVSSSYYNAFSYPEYANQPNGWTCEPAYAFGDATSPNCEGWVHSQDGNPHDSIAALAHESPTCTDSVGRVCTVDTVDLWATPTDPLSHGWATGARGGGPGSGPVLTDSGHILQAGCDLAAATNGSWDGPAFATCPDGRQGDLEYVDHGSVFKPHTENPTLFRALTHIGFGPVVNPVELNASAAPLFTWVPPANLAPAAEPQWSTSCSHANGSAEPQCPVAPTVAHVAGMTVYGWNWSPNATRNVLHAGDAWSASFNVISIGPPFGWTSVDLCNTWACRVIGAGPVAGLFSAATYVSSGTTTVLVTSFPPASILIEAALPPGGLGPPPPPPPPAPPSLPIVVAPTVPLLNPSLVGTQVGIGNVSLTAVSAGFLGAGFLRVTVKNRPMAVKVAAMAGATPKPAPSAGDPSYLRRE